MVKATWLEKPNKKKLEKRKEKTKRGRGRKEEKSRGAGRKPMAVYLKLLA
jgi:hypothetical protein